MPAKNLFKIYKVGEEYQTDHIDRDKGLKPEKVKKCKKVEDAIKEANKYIINNKVEYDIVVYP